MNVERERLQVIRAAAQGRVKAEAVAVGAQVLLEVRFSGHDALDRQQFLPDARIEGNAIGTRCGLQQPELAGFVRIAVAGSHVGGTLLFDQHPSTGEQLHQSDDDFVQQHLQRFVAWLGNFDELRRPVNVAPVHAVQRQAVKVNIQFGGQASLSHPLCLQLIQ